MRGPGPSQTPQTVTPGSAWGGTPACRAQPNRPAASQIATEEGKQTQKKDKTENADGRG